MSNDMLPYPEPALLAVVMDNDAQVRKSIITVLYEAGIVAVEANTISEAISYIQKMNGQVDLLFIECKINDGNECVYSAREVAKNWQNIEIVLCSGVLELFLEDTDDGIYYVKESLDATVVDNYLNKPLR